jgi:DNA-binding PadR family transcriptional regulator
MTEPDSTLLGTLEHLILLAVLALGTDAYGMTIRDEIHSRAGRDLSFGTIYVTLQRLEAKGLVTASMGAPTPERGGRAKRFFKITADGRRAVRRSQDALNAMTAAWRDARTNS